MGLETVRITVLDQSNAPLDGVVVRVFDSSGTTLITSGESGNTEPGVVEFTLEGDVSPTLYSIRFFISGGRVNSPQNIQVYSPPSGAPSGANNFEVDAVVFHPPETTDPKLCRCSGYVRGPSGMPKRGITFQFIPKFNPLVVGGAAVLGERSTRVTDENGYVTIDLYRHGMYQVTVESQENAQREVVVPDVASILISNLLFPVVDKVSWDPVGPWTFAVKQDFEVTPDVGSTDLQTLGVASSDVQYTVDDESIAGVTVLSDRIVLRGIAPGVTTLRVTRTDNSIVYLPDPGISGGSIGIIVTAP